MDHTAGGHDPGERGVFWPNQILRNGLACAAVLGVVLLLAWWRPAELSAPADPAEPFAAARPEWYFLSLFRFLKFEAVEGSFGLAFGAIVLPGILFAIVFLMPLIARIPGGHAFNVGFTALLLSAAAGLTGLAWYEDHYDVAHQTALRIAAGVMPIVRKRWLTAHHACRWQEHITAYERIHSLKDPGYLRNIARPAIITMDIMA